MVINVLQNGGLNPLNVFFDGTNPFHLQGFFHWWPFPPTVPRMPSYLYRNFSGHPIMKTLYNRQHHSHNHPALIPINQQRLNHRLVYHRLCPHLHSCLPQYCCHQFPPPSGLLKILVHGRPVAVIVCNCAAHLQEGLCGIHWL